MSPPAATERSPEAVTGPLAGREGGDEGIGGGGATETPSPVATDPMLPPAATERAPLAVTAAAPAGAPGPGPRKAYNVTANPISPAAPPATLAQGSAASTSSTAPISNPTAPATQSPTPVHTNAFDRFAIPPSWTSAKAPGS